MCIRDRHYLVLKTAISLVTGLVVWGMLVLLDVRFAFMWGRCV